MQWIRFSRFSVIAAFLALFAGNIGQTDSEATVSTQHKIKQYHLDSSFAQVVISNIFVGSLPFNVLANATNPVGLLSVYYLTQGNNTLGSLVPDTGAPTGQVEVCDTPRGIVLDPGGQGVYVTCSGVGDGRSGISRVATNGTVSYFKTSQLLDRYATMVCVSQNAKCDAAYELWTINIGFAGEIDIFDANQLRFPPLPINNSSHSLYQTPVSPTAKIFLGGRSAFRALTTCTDSLGNPLVVYGITQRNNNRTFLHAIDPKSRKLLGQVISAAANPSLVQVQFLADAIGLVLTSNCRTAYTVGYSDGNVYAFSLPDPATIATLPAAQVVATQTAKIAACKSPGDDVAPGAEDLALWEAGQRLLVACGSTNKVAVIDLTSGNLSAEVAVGALPRAIAVYTNGATNRAYTANFESGTISVINLISSRQDILSSLSNIGLQLEAAGRSLADNPGDLSNIGRRFDSISRFFLSGDSRNGEISQSVAESFSNGDLRNAALNLARLQGGAEATRDSVARFDSSVARYFGEASQSLQRAAFNVWEASRSSARFSLLTSAGTNISSAGSAIRTGVRQLIQFSIWPWDPECVCGTIERDGNRIKRYCINKPGWFCPNYCGWEDDEVRITKIIIEEALLPKLLELFGTAGKIADLLRQLSKLPNCIRELLEALKKVLEQTTRANPQGGLADAINFLSKYGECVGLPPGVGFYVSPVTVQELVNHVAQIENEQKQKLIDAIECTLKRLQGESCP